MKRDELFSTESETVVRAFREKAGRYGDESILNRVLEDLENLARDLEACYWASLFARNVASAEVATKTRGAIAAKAKSTIELIRHTALEGRSLDLKEHSFKLNQTQKLIEDLNQEIMQKVVKWRDGLSERCSRLADFSELLPLQDRDKIAELEGLLPNGMPLPDQIARLTGREKSTLDSTVLTWNRLLATLNRAESRL